MSKTSGSVVQLFQLARKSPKKTLKFLGLSLGVLGSLALNVGCKPRSAQSGLRDQTVTDIVKDGKVQYAIYAAEIDKTEAERVMQIYRERGLFPDTDLKVNDTLVYLDECPPDSPNSQGSRRRTANASKPGDSPSKPELEDSESNVKRDCPTGEKSDPLFYKNRSICKGKSGVAPIPLKIYQDNVFNGFYPGNYGDSKKELSILAADIALVEGDINFNQAAFDRLIGNRPEQSGDKFQRWFNEANELEAQLAGYYEEKEDYLRIQAKMKSALESADFIIAGLECTNEQTALSGEFNNGVEKIEPPVGPFLVQPRIISEFEKKDIIQKVEIQQSFDSFTPVTFNIEREYTVSGVFLRVEFLSRYPKPKLTTRLSFQPESGKSVQIDLPAGLANYNCSFKHTERSAADSKYYECTLSIRPETSTYPSDFLNRLDQTSQSAKGTWSIAFAQDSFTDKSYPIVIESVRLKVGSSTPLVDLSKRSFDMFDVPIENGKSTTIDIPWFNPSSLAAEFPISLSIAGKKDLPDGLQVDLLSPRGKKFRLGNTNAINKTQIIGVGRGSRTAFVQFIEETKAETKGWKVNIENGGSQPVSLSGIQVSPQNATPNQQVSGQAQAPVPLPASRTAIVPRIPPRSRSGGVDLDPGVLDAMMEIHNNIKNIMGSTPLPNKERENCLKVTPQDRWSDIMAHYYCSFPGVAIRKCFTGKVQELTKKAGASANSLDIYEESYSFCSQQTSGTEFPWIAANQPNVFKYIMFTVGRVDDSFTKSSQDSVIDEYYKNIKYGSRPAR